MPPALITMSPNSHSLASSFPNPVPSFPHHFRSKPFTYATAEAGRLHASHFTSPFSFPSGPKVFRLCDVEAATNHWHEDNLLGQGGFGDVYKAPGLLGVANKPCAVKRAHTMMRGGIDKEVRRIRRSCCLFFRLTSSSTHPIRTIANKWTS